MGGNQEEKQDEKQNKAFADDISYFLSKEQFNFYDFHERVTVSLFVNFDLGCCVECFKAEIEYQDDDLGR
jgi:hypothetical protein